MKSMVMIEVNWYSLVPNWGGPGGGGGRAVVQILKKTPQVHLIIIREWPTNNPSSLILRNLDNFPPGAFYWTSPCPLHHQHIHLKEKKPVLLVNRFKNFLHQKIYFFSNYKYIDLYIWWLMTKETCIWK